MKGYPPLGKKTGKYTKKSERWIKSATDEEILQEYRKNGGWVMLTARKCGVDRKRVQQLARKVGL